MIESRHKPRKDKKYTPWQPCPPPVIASAWYESIAALLVNHKKVTTESASGWIIEYRIAAEGQTYPNKPVVWTGL